MNSLKRAGRFLLRVAITLLALAATGATGGTCGGSGVSPTLNVCTTASDCPRLPMPGPGQWACVDGGCQWQECAVAADCAVRSHEDCTGSWSCANLTCAWTCDSNPPPACLTAADCAGATHADCAGAWSCTQNACAWACIEPPNCVASGCSGEICATQSMDSDCVWKDWFACLKYTSCGLMADGTCGFADNDAYRACLAGVSPCSDNVDCPSGFECLDGTCSTIACVPSPEICDGKDNNCDGVIDEGCSAATCTADADCPTLQYCDLTAATSAPGCCVRLADGSGCPADYPECQGVCRTRDVACVTDTDCGTEASCVNGTCVAGPTCRAVQPGSHGSCKMVIGVLFDGKQCVLEGGCTCEPDCDALFPSMDACNTACGIVTGCTTDSECQAGEACIAGACQAVASTCTQDTDCAVGRHCDGYVCGNGWCSGTCTVNPDGVCAKDADCPTGDSCVKVACMGCIGCPCYGTCQGAAACTPVKPGSHGACDMILGFVFDGNQCAYESGCSCQPDCAAFFQDLASCQSACTSG